MLKRKIEAIDEAIQAAQARAKRTKQSTVVTYHLKAGQTCFRVHGSVCEANTKGESSEAVRCIGMYSFEDAQWIPASRAFQIVSERHVI
jgi:hypothetical protein